MAEPCNARQPNGILRCERAKAHRGFHKATHGNVIVEWPSHRSEKRYMSGSSPDQDYRTGVLHGILAERIHERLATAGFFECEGGCGKKWSTLTEALDVCDPAHVENRSQLRAPKSKRDIEQSADDPFNVKAKCRPCHDKEHNAARKEV